MPETSPPGGPDQSEVPEPAPRPPSFARTSLSLLADQTHVNLLGKVHGGEVMRLVDSTAGAIAQRHSGGPAVTAAMDEMAFLQAVHVGDIVRTVGQVNWAGRTSMEIGVRVESERWDQETPTEVRRQREAEIRRAHRLAQRAEIEQGRRSPGVP